MKIQALEIFFIIFSLIVGIVYGYLLGKNDAREKANKIIRPAPYAATGDPILDAYDAGYRDGVIAAKRAIIE